MHYIYLPTNVLILIYRHILVSKYIIYVYIYHYLRVVVAEGSSFRHKNLGHTLLDE